MFQRETCTCLAFVCFGLIFLLCSIPIQWFNATVEYGQIYVELYFLDVVLFKEAV